MTTTTKVIVGVLGAAAAGVIVGMLIAPEKGSDLRKSLKKSADDLADEMTNWVGKGKSFLAEMKHRAEAGSEELQAQAEESLTGIKENLSRRKL